VIRALIGFFALWSGVALAAEQVACHYTYGGETSTVVAGPVRSPYAVKPLAVGSYFLFRVVFEANPVELSAVKIYTYVDHPDGPALLHQGSYPYPANTRGKGPFGFTGQQSVYEPVRDSELQYWCEMQPFRSKP